MLLCRTHLFHFFLDFLRSVFNLEIRSISWKKYALKLFSAGVAVNAPIPTIDSRNGYFQDMFRLKKCTFSMNLWSERKADWLDE